MKLEMKSPTSRIPAIQGRIHKLNKRAARYGLAPVLMELGETETVKVCLDPEHPSYKIDVEYTHFTIEGETPTVDGWEFVAKIEHEDGANIVQGVPDSILKTPHTMVERRPFCDHCGTHRLKRVSFVIHKDGEFKQVGRSCLKDFFDRSVEAQVWSLAMWNGIKDDLEEEFGGWSSEDMVYPVNEALAVAASSIRQWGFKKSDSDVPTKLSISVWFGLVRIDGFNTAQITPTEDDVATAEKTVVWLMEQEGGSEYIDNLKKLVGLEMVRPKYFGYLAAAVNSYQSSLAKKAEAEYGKSDAWVGEVGERIEIDVTLERMIVKERSSGGYGWVDVPQYVYIHIFRDAEGHKLVWFGSKIVGNEGEQMKIRGTVKVHSEYNGSKDTVITRVRVQD